VGEEGVKLEEVGSYEQLREVLERADWRRFEEIVGKIFEFHDYEVEVGKVVTFEEFKRQYDVIAERGHWILTDCKKWDNKRRIKYGLKKAVEDQIERVRKIPKEGDKYPLVVLSCNAPMRMYKKVPIVSIHELNNFLSNFFHNEKAILSL